MIPEFSNRNEAATTMVDDRRAAAASAAVPRADDVSGGQSAADQFPATLRAALAEQDAATLRLRREVCRYVSARKADGWAPEVVYASMRALARRIATSDDEGSEPRRVVDPKITEALVAQITQWCVGAYYRAD
jgi:hypothetical protein